MPLSIQSWRDFDPERYRMGSFQTKVFGEGDIEGFSRLENKTCAFSTWTPLRRAIQLSRGYHSNVKERFSAGILHDGSGRIVERIMQRRPRDLLHSEL